MEVTKDEFLDASAAKFDTPEMFEANGVYRPTDGDYINLCSNCQESLRPTLSAERK